MKHRPVSARFFVAQYTPQVDRDGGSRLAIDASPILRGLSLYRAALKPLGLREPHWHPNANELTYCLTGEALVTIFRNGSIHTRFRYGRAKCFSSHPAIFITSKIQLQLRRNLSSPSPMRGQKTSDASFLLGSTAIFYLILTRALT